MPLKLESDPLFPPGEPGPGGAGLTLPIPPPPTTTG